jgi:hypothetical protein
MEGAWWVLLAVTGAIAAIAAALAWRPCRAALRDAQLARAKRDFHRQREHLEARFLQLAGNSGKPRGLEWSNCDFEDAVVYARDRRSGELSAFVAVCIRFEAVEGGDMEGVEAVGNLRAATAVFRVRKGHWATDGRAIFNLNPTEAVRYFQEKLELVGQEPH